MVLLNITCTDISDYVRQNINIVAIIYTISDIMAMTTIAVSAETKEALRRVGEKGETYDKIIRRLVIEVGWKELDQRWNQILEEDDFIPLDEL